MEALFYLAVCLGLVGIVLILAGGILERLGSILGAFEVRGQARRDARERAYWEQRAAADLEAFRRPRHFNCRCSPVNPEATVVSMDGDRAYLERCLRQS